MLNVFSALCPELWQLHAAHIVDIVYRFSVDAFILLGRRMPVSLLVPARTLLTLSFFSHDKNGQQIFAGPLAVCTYCIRTSHTD